MSWALRPTRAGCLETPFDTDAEDPNHCVTPVYHDGMLYVTSGHREGGQTELP